MKSRTIILILLTCLLSMGGAIFAQNAPVDFEVGGNGADWTWIVAEDGTNPALEIIANPVSGGINTTATVAQFTAELAGQPWALFHSEGIGEFTFDATNSTVKIMVNKPVISNVGLKFEGAGPVLELTVPNTLINEWEELTFDFSSLIGNTYNKIVVIPDFDFTPRAQDNIVYLDNVTFSEQIIIPDPGPYAPVDFEVAGNGADWEWIVAEDGTNPALEIIANPMSGGINTTATVAQFTAELAGQPWALFHSEGIGTFTFDATNSTVKIMVNKPVISNVGLKFEGVGPVLELTVPNTLINEWEELTFDFSSLIGNTYNKIVVIPDFDFTPRAQDNIVYLDNVTFSEQIIIPDPGPYAPVDFEVAGNGADWEWIVAEDGTNPALEIIANPMSGGINTTATVAQFTAELAGQPWALFHSEGIGEFTFDATNSTVKIMVNKPVISNVGLKFEGAGPVLELTVPNTLINEWEELTFDFSSLIGNTYNKIVVIPDFDFTPRAQDNIVYLDNVTFSEQIISDPEPIVAAPAPIHDAADVMSIYSGTYTNLAETNFNPNWGQSTTVTVDADVAGTNTILYETLNYQGTNLGGADGVDQDVSGYDYLHVDFWTANAPALNFFLISRTTGEQAYSLPITAGEWVSMDIPLTHYADLGLSLTDIYQFKVDGGDGATSVWFDNWYFYTGEVVSPTPHAPIDFEVAGHGADWEWTVTENGTNPALEILANPMSGGINTSATVAKFTAELAGQPWALFHSEGIGVFTFDATNSTVKIMVNKPVISNVGLKFEGIGPVLELTVPNTLINEWEELTFDFSSLIGNTYNKIVVIPDFDFTPRAQDNIVYLDNVTFSEQIIIPDPGPYAPIDFEVGGNGADWTWIVAEDGTNPALEILANPMSGGINTSATVAKFTAELAGQPWALFHSEGIGVFTFDATNSTVKIMVNKPVISNVGLKFEGIGPVLELTVPNTLINEWEELTFDFSSLIGNTYNKIVVIPDFDFTPRAQDNIVYLDNVTFSEQIISDPEPIVAAPAPIHDAADVMSIYSGTYTNLAETNFNPNWGQSTTVTVDADVAGTNTILYETLNYQGTNLGGADGVDQDVSGYDYLHVDFWTANAPALNFFLISRTTGEQAFALPITPGEWVSMEIPLAHYVDLGLSLTDIFQFKVDGGDGATSVWYDNWYFYSVPPVEPLDIAGIWVVAPEAAALMVGPNPNDGSWWSNSADDVTTRACFFDDKFVFNEDGSFANVMDGDTWLETWQGVQADGCGAPIAPHDGSNAATYASDAGAGTVTLNGVGSYLGIPKAFNGGELGNPADAPASITYDVMLSDNNETMTAVLDIGGGYWTFKLVKFDPSDVVDNVVPDDFALKQNYPNPFNPSTTIRYSLIESGHVVLKLFNIRGQEVTTLVNGMASPGEYAYYLDASDLAAGTYLYAITAGNQTIVKKMVLIK